MSKPDRIADSVEPIDILSNLQTTDTDTDTDETKTPKVGVKIGGKTKKALFDLAEQTGNKKILAFLETAKDSGLISDSTRVSNASDAPKMKNIRVGFKKLCKDNSDGYDLNNNGTKVHYCIDLDGVKRIPRLYIKSEKAEETEVEETEVEEAEVEETNEDTKK
ncbi:hypothetical protein CMI47_16505 [Candidatus Pacearchaeota archaeon]|jgi:hypothetical protein|nr:hypothetical protein [Candidatus Pacearchaeota archaeon]|tara:strand:- start:11795 stop:12283 length:489 start_codon:yes stop_codon:yes gene_type:complete